MAYEEIGDVQTVVLGGRDKKSGKVNPTQVEGHFVGVESRPNRFNPTKPQNYYIFQTAEGLRGVFGKAGIDKVMKGALLGAMVKLVSTGELLDTGKGNPMKVFKAYQDKNNRIDTSDIAYNLPTDGEGAATEGETQYAVGDGYEDTELGEEEAPVDELPPTRAAAPARPAQAPSAAKVAQVQAMLRGRTGSKTA